MANKFKLWVEDANINATQTYNDFDSDTQRAGGFVGGTPASAIRVNTALRQANLIACALMDVVAPNDNTIDFRSSRADTATFLGSKLKAYIGFSVDEKGVLKHGTNVVAQRKLVWSGDLTGTITERSQSMSIDITAAGITYKQNTHYEIQGYYVHQFSQNTYKNYWQTNWYFDNGQKSPYARYGIAQIFGPYCKSDADSVFVDMSTCGINMSAKSINFSIYAGASGSGATGVYDYFPKDAVMGVTAIYEIIQ